MIHLRHIVFSILPAFAFLALAAAPFALNGQTQQFIFERVQGVYMQPAAYTLDADEYGRIWYGTWGRGVMVYDGYQFTRYQNIPGDSNSLVNDRIIDLVVDQKKRVWVSTMNGLDCIQRTTGQFRHFQEVGDSIFQFMAVYEDQMGQIWASGAKGTLRFHEKSQTFENIRPFSKRAPAARPNVFYEDNQGTLWLGRGDGLLRFSMDRNTYDYLPVCQPGTDKDPFRVGAILEDRQNNFWLAGYDGLLIYDRSTGQVSRPQLPDSLAFWRFSALELDAQGGIWMALPEKGLYRWEPATGRLQHFQHNELDPTSLPSNNAYALLYDRFGNLWTGTDRGLARLNLLPQPFSRWLIEPSNPNLDRNNIIRIAQDPTGGILVRTQKELFYLEKFGSTPIPLVPGKNRPENFEPDDFVKDQAGNIWAIYDGIFRWDPALRTFARVPNLLQTDRVLAMAQDHEESHIWWLGTLDGLLRFDQRAGDLHLFKNVCKPGQTRGIGKIVDDKQGHLWIIASAVLTRFDKKSEASTFFSSKTPLPHQLSNDEVLDLRLSPDGWLWANTASGISLINLATGDFQSLHQQDGLPDNLALSVFFDLMGNAWIVFPEHIVRKDVKTGQLRTWNTAAAFQTGQLSRAGGCLLQDGRLLIACRGGILLVDPAQMDEIMPPSTILLTRFETTVKGEKRALAPEFLKHVQLSNAENNLTIAWSGIQTARAGELQYECTLEKKGEQKAWEQKGAERQAVYANLDPGAYTFKVRIAGMESPELSIEIAIAPAWWQAESFKMLILALLATAAYLYWRNQEDRRELLQQKELAEQNANYKTRFLANMSHEIRTPMNAILGLSRLLTESKLPPKQSDYADAIRHSSENLLVIINDVLDQVKIESGKFTFQHKPFDLEVIVRHLHNTLGFKAAEKGLKFELNIQPSTPTRLVGDPVRLNQILTNLLGNAIKFTEQGIISLDIHSTPTGEMPAPGPPEKSSKNGKPKSSSEKPLAMITFSVSDTGIGMTPEQAERVFESFQQADDEISANYGGTGLGLSITKDLVEQQLGKIELESEAGKGTRLSATIPFELDTVSAQDAQQAVQPSFAFENMRILLVEDTFFNQMLAIELLKSRIPGVTIDVAENGQVALEKIESSPDYDLVLMDVKMPVMDGLEATRRLRARPKGQALPIIALTANAVQAELEKCQVAGMDAWVTKPIDADELFATMLRAMDRPKPG